MKSILLLLALALFPGCGNGSSTTSTPANNTVQEMEITHTCDNISVDGALLTYCYEDAAILNPARIKNRVIYLFHGMQGTPQQFFSGTRAEVLAAIEQKLGNNAPVFISLSTGPLGIFKENAADIATQAIPAIEAHLKLAATIQRDLVGESMGSYNLLCLAAAAPSMFHSLAPMCPALITFNPFDTAQIAAYFQRHPTTLNQGFAAQIFQVFAQTFTDVNSWNANNPFTLLAAGDYDHLKIFTSVGMQDTLGFEEGTQAFVDAAQKRSIDIKYSPVNGPHCSFDVGGLEQFETTN